MSFILRHIMLQVGDFCNQWEMTIQLFRSLSHHLEHVLLLGSFLTVITTVLELRTLNTQLGTINRHMTLYHAGVCRTVYPVRTKFFLCAFFRRLLPLVKKGKTTNLLSSLSSLR